MLSVVAWNCRAGTSSLASRLLSSADVPSDWEKQYLSPLDEAGYCGGQPPAASIIDSANEATVDFQAPAGQFGGVSELIFARDSQTAHKMVREVSDQLTCQQYTQTKSKIPVTIDIVVMEPPSIGDEAITFRQTAHDVPIVGTVNTEHAIVRRGGIVLHLSLSTLGPDDAAFQKLLERAYAKLDGL